MRIAAGGRPRAWPETLLLEDLDLGRTAIEAAVAQSQRLELSAPLRLGADPDRDLAALRFLTAAAEQMAEVRWTLAGEPPWPVRTLVHLPPPDGGADPSAQEYVAQWRLNHRYGLCTYRLGPGFVRIRDVRPGGRHLRVVIDGPWAEAFVAGITEGPGRQLRDELVAAGLAVAVGAETHVLPVRLRRWPIPYTEI